MIGYLAAGFFVASGVGVTLLGELLLAHFYFSVSFLLVTTLMVSLFWGKGPGLLASLLSSLALGSFSFLPEGEPDFLPLSWEVLFRWLPFTLANFIITLLTGQREAARRSLQKQTHALRISNQELQQANHLKDDFLTRAAHELRTPLTTILGETQLALRRLNKPGSLTTDYQKSLEKVEERAKHLRILIDALLEISSLRSNEAPVRRAFCDFSAICRQAIEDQQMLSDQPMVVHLPLQPLLLYADGEQLSQVVTSLLENAVQYSLAQTTIDVRLGTDQGGVLLQVANAGPELSPEQREQAFEPFYRTSSAQNAFREGWGVGLTISREIVRQHNGHIWIESTKARGITLSVHLPFAEEKEMRTLIPTATGE